MKTKDFQKLVNSIPDIGSALTPKQKMELVNMLGFQEETDNFGQFLYYTGYKRDEKTGRIRNLRDTDTGDL